MDFFCQFLGVCCVWHGNLWCIRNQFYDKACLILKYFNFIFRNESEFELLLIAALLLFLLWRIHHSRQQPAAWRSESESEGNLDVLIIFLDFFNFFRISFKYCWAARIRILYLICENGFMFAEWIFTDGYGTQLDGL